MRSVLVKLLRAKYGAAAKECVKQIVDLRKLQTWFDVPSDCLETTAMDGSCAADVARRTIRVAVATTLRATTRSSRASTFQSREGLHRDVVISAQPFVPYWYA